MQKSTPLYCVIFTSILLLGILSSTYAVKVYNVNYEKPKIEIPENNGDIETLTQDKSYQSLSESEILYTADNNWNPHKVGLSSTIWNASFNEDATLTMRNSHNENGHVAMGVWWHEFPSKSRIPLDETKVTVEFDVTLHQIEYNPDDSFLRIALASAILDDSGNVWYTEIDIWDSPVTDELPENPDLIHVSYEVVEFKFFQISTGEKIHLTIPLSNYIHRAWDSRVDSAYLESVYIVIESLEESHDSQDYVEVSVNNFLITFQD